MRAERGAEGGRLRHPFADDHRRHLVQFDAAVRFRDVDAEQAELAAALHQVARQRPLLLFQAVERRQHLVVNEIGDGLRDQPLLVGQPLGREHVGGAGRLQQPLAAAQGCGRR